MDTESEFQKDYDSEINYSIGTSWDCRLQRECANVHAMGPMTTDTSAARQPAAFERQGDLDRRALYDVARRVQGEFANSEECPIQVLKT
jgi:hypothetical protein